MDIVSRLPFRLTFSDTHYNTVHCNYFAGDVYSLYKSDKVTVELEENEEIWVMFDSADRDARLYLEALDSIPDGHGIRLDDYGKLFKSPSRTSFPLFLNNGEFGALCVDKYVMKIICQGQEYYGILSIRPKQLQQDEWLIMKDEIEQEMKDLGKQALRGGMTTCSFDAISEEEWNTLIFFHENKSWLLSALQDIIEHPKYKIVTKYLTTASGKTSKHNRKTIQYMLQKGEEHRKLLLYKEISYNTLENQFLKSVMQDCKKCLKVILDKLSNLLMDEQDYWDKEKLSAYFHSGRAIYQFIVFLEGQNWYGEITEQSTRQMSRSIFMDDRYGYIYTVYQKLQNPGKMQCDFIVHTTEWKPSSLLYEMWCFIKLCKMFEERWSTVSWDFNHCFCYENGMPILKEGCCMEYQREDIHIKIFYNPILPRISQKTKLEDQPYYMLNSHVQPDIVLHIYQEKVYLGSIVMECKYRKVSSFWNGSTMSSREQIMSYWHGSKSCYFMGKIGELLDVRPVKCVYVLTPDETCEEKMDGKIQLTSVRPGNDGSLENLYQSIEDRIGECKELVKVFEKDMW